MRSRCSAQLIQLETASFRRRSASPSLLCSRAAVCEASAKTVCGLRQVRSLRMLIPAATKSTSAWQAKLFRCAIPTPRRPIAPPAVQSMSLTEAAFLETLPCCFLSLPLHVLCRSRATHCTGEAGAAQKSRSRVRGFGGVFTFFCKWCTFDSSIVCFRVSV